MDYRFDVFNARTFDGSNKLDAAFGKNYDLQVEAIQKMAHVVSTMRAGKRKSLLPFQKGILIGIQALIQMYQQLSSERGVQYIRTVCLNQDILENFFSRIRSLGHAHSHPGNFICGKPQAIR